MPGRHTTDLETNYLLIAENWRTNTDEGHRASFGVEKFEMIGTSGDQHMLIFDDAGKAPFLSKTQLWCDSFEIKLR